MSANQRKQKQINNTRNYKHSNNNELALAYTIAQIVGLKRPGKSVLFLKKRNIVGHKRPGK